MHAVQHVDGDRRVKDSPSLSSSHPSGTYDGPTFDLYRPLSIFCNLLLRILNVRIVSAEGSRVRRERDASNSSGGRNALARTRHQEHHQQQFLLPTSPWGDAALIFPRIFSFLSLLLRYLTFRLTSSPFLSLSVSLPSSRASYHPICFSYYLSLPPLRDDSISTICTAVDR